MNDEDKVEEEENEQKEQASSKRSTPILKYHKTIFYHHDSKSIKSIYLKNKYILLCILEIMCIYV